MTAANTQFIEKPLPSSPDAERCIVGGILVENELITQAVGSLLPEDFYSPVFRRVYAVMLELFAARQTIDPIWIGEKLKKDNLLDSMGGIATITNYTYGLPRFGDIRGYIEIVKEKRRRRDLARIASQIAAMAVSEDDTTETLLSYAQTAINDVCANREQKGFSSAGDLSVEQVNDTAELINGKTRATGLHVGLKEIDFITGGFQPSDLIIIAGRPAQGKSSLAGQMAMNACDINRDVVLPIFSLEMSKKQYIQRLFSSRAGVDTQKMKDGTVSRDEFQRMKNAAVEISRMNLLVDDSSVINALQIRSALIRLKQEKGRLDGVVIDFLQRMSASGKTDGRQQEVSLISRELKTLAKDLQIPVIVLSSLSRAVEARSPPRPRMSDLRESGDIESEADFVAFVYRENYYNPSAEPHLAEFIIDKNRHGRTDTVKLNFMREYTRFTNY